MSFINEITSKLADASALATQKNTRINSKCQSSKFSIQRKNEAR
ncbi:hypothetical protein ACTGW9_10310 [Streptococcus suis]